MISENNESIHEERLEYHLQVQANQIQNVFNHHNAQTRITGGVANNHSFNFNLRLPFTTGIKKLSTLLGDLKRALGIKSIRINHESGQFQLQVLRPTTAAVPLLDLLSMTKSHSPASVILGLAENGAVIQHDFSSDATPNILVSGDTGAGKTNLLRTIAVSLALTNRQSDIQLVAINPTSADSRNRDAQMAAWQPLNYIPHFLTDVVTRQTEITDLLLFLVREMNYRSDHMFNFPRIVLLIDQAATTMERGGQTVSEAILRIAERGANAGIHLVLSTQRPDSNQFGPHLLTNLQSRYIGRGNQNPNHFYDSDIARSAANLLGQGDFLSCGLAPAARFQAAYIDDYDLHMGLSKFYQKRPKLLARPLSTRNRLNPPTESSLLEKQFEFVDGMVAFS